MSAFLNGFHQTEPRRGIRPGFPFWSPRGSEGSYDYRADLGDVHHTFPVVWLGLTLFEKKFGLLIVEVKDWTARQVISCNPLQFTIRVSGKSEKKTNPDKQAKGYVNTLMEKLNEFPFFSPITPNIWVN